MMADRFACRPLGAKTTDFPRDTPDGEFAPGVGGVVGDVRDVSEFHLGDDGLDHAGNPLVVERPEYSLPVLLKQSFRGLVELDARNHDDGFYATTTLSGALIAQAFAVRVRGAALDRGASRGL